ncbi:MAG: glycosyltransferase [Acidobacteria bacterium]|nr:glycosyltransferase [Acidobacteriota bacterium]
MSTSRVSVVIPACNAASHLARCLAALAGGAPAGTEVIVVDDASRDGTPELAATLGARVVRQPVNGGPSRARNAGARAASGEILYFVDSDVVVHPGAIQHVADFFASHPEAAAMFGSYDDQPVVPGVISQYRNLLHHFTHQTGRRDASTFWSGCGAIRRAAFLAVGGFNEATHPRCIEDIELGYRLRQAGHAIVLDPTLLCTHLKQWTLRSMVLTDVFCRAIPWARLNRARGSAPDDLNIKQSQKLSVLLTGLALLCVPLAFVNPWFLAGSALAVMAVVALNRHLFEFLCRTRGRWFALRCIPLHLLYFLYSGASFAWVQAAGLLGITPRDWNAERTTDPPARR